MNSEMHCNVIVTLQIEGLHRWEKCNIQEVSFLKNFHRHIFYVTCKKEVKHDDRDVEIICFKRQILRYLHQEYGDRKKVLNFAEKSCEMLARELAEEFNLCYCSVMEDGENGAEYTA